MSADQVLAIDVGTQSARAIVFDSRGDMLGKAQQVFKPAYQSPKDGWAEQEPAIYWQAVCTATRALWDEQGLDPARVAGISLTTQRGTVICLDKHGEPLRPAILWLDQRRRDDMGKIGGLWGALFKLVGVDDTIAQFMADAQGNWLKQAEPALWARTHKFVFLSGYLTHKLTGKFVDSAGCQVGYVPFDYKAHAWAKSWDWKWQAAGVPRDKLLPLVPVGQQLGPLSSTAAEALGMPAGIPLIASAGDKACEVLGAGALAPDVACLGYGTTATINTTSAKYVEATRYLPAYPAAVPGHYNTEIQIFRGYWMVSWFKDEFADPERRAAQAQGTPTEAMLDELVAQSPPGAKGLLLQPYWSPGIREPGPEAKGAIIGFTDSHTRADMYRSILEGIAFALRAGRARIQRRTGITVSQLRVAGGGSQSEAAMQITADIFNMPAQRPHVYEASALGAAINAAVGVGLHADYAIAVAAMTRPGTVFNPIPDHVALYDRLYRKGYSRMYKRLQPLYRELGNLN
ncbi:carbohydrate kinase [bacterium]|nr:carbohydrate kinase [bacterium]